MSFASVLAAAVVVFGAGDVILAKILPCLDLYENELLSARILDPVPRTLRDINGLAGRKMQLFFVAGDYGLPVEYEPVLSPSRMLLEREPLPAVYKNPFYLVVRPIVKYAKVTPGAPLFFVHQL